MHLIETVTGPSPSDGSETAKMTAAQCDDTRWRTDIPNPSWLRLDLSASWITGSALVDESIPVFGSGGEGWVAWSGNVDPYQAYCTAVIVGINGHATAVATAVAPVDTSDAPGAGRSWSAGLYGFSQLYERETPTSPPLTYTECRLELGPGATSQAALLPRVPAVAGFGQDCLFGKHPS